MTEFSLLIIQDTRDMNEQWLAERICRPFGKPRKITSGNKRLWFIDGNTEYEYVDLLDFIRSTAGLACFDKIKGTGFTVMVRWGEVGLHGVYQRFSES